MVVFNNRGGGQGMARRERFENGSDINAFLGEGTNFKGVLVFEGTVRIDGKLEGEISSEDTLIVGEQAIVNAEINVGSVVVSGKVSGDITAKKRVDIKASGEVYGNIQAPILTIDEGVIFQGTCDMRRSGDEQVRTQVLPERKLQEIEEPELEDRYGYEAEEKVEEEVEEEAENTLPPLEI